MGRTRLGVVLALLLAGWAIPGTATQQTVSESPRIPPSALTPIADAVAGEVASGRIPAAVVVIGQGSEVLYRRSFGDRPGTDGAGRSPIAADTIFDLASLTKVVATTTAIMQLVDRRQLQLDAAASSYWPAFGGGGKDAITIRDLLTHYSGLKPDLDLSRPWKGYETAMAMLAAEKPRVPPGRRYVYSDENFEVLGEIVQQVTGKPLDEYCARHIFQPLGMRDTRFRPTSTDVARVAPTSAARADADAVVVNDPTARRMGGVAGHAGLFSTADDLAIFARMLLDGGTVGGVRVLEQASVAAMIQRASPADGSHPRGLGWDLGPSFLPARDGIQRQPSFGHTGYTGTMLWVDPDSRTYVVVLTNRTYAHGGDAQPLRRAVLAQVSSVLEGGGAAAATTLLSR
jgi:CubicO group peptidase (beta-lactamase class C family)